MKNKLIFIIPISIILISALIFFLVPNSLEILSFSGSKFISGEYWRLLTFSFTHVTPTHLFENIIAISLVGFLGYEFGLRGKLFLTYFLAISFTIALVNSLLFPLLIIAGASLGIYGVLGVLSIKGSNFIPKLYLIPLLGASIFLKYILTLFSCPTCDNDISQTLFHFSGFLTGLVLIYIPKKFSLSKKRNILGKASRFNN